MASEEAETRVTEKGNFFLVKGLFLFGMDTGPPCGSSCKHPKHAYSSRSERSNLFRSTSWIWTAGLLTHHWQQGSALSVQLPEPLHWHSSQTQGANTTITGPPYPYFWFEFPAVPEGPNLTAGKGPWGHVAAAFAPWVLKPQQCRWSTPPTRCQLDSSDPEF